MYVCGVCGGCGVGCGGVGVRVGWGCGGGCGKKLKKSEQSRKKSTPPIKKIVTLPGRDAA